LGAGRSGTTIFALLLSRSMKITWPGELHHLYSSVDNIKCSCGKQRHECVIWEDYQDYISNLTSRSMRHYGSHFFRLLARKTRSEIVTKEYNLFDRISSEANLVLDSSKYLDRYKILKKMKNIDVMAYYIVRDPRGVVWSFMKKTSQSSRSFISAIIYYMLVNFRIELYKVLDTSIVKIRYEDIEDYNFSANSKYKFGEENLKYREHVLGSNRFMRDSPEDRFEVDDTWRQALPRWKQIVVYSLTFPLCVINKYKP
jgi:hypothetical protein